MSFANKVVLVIGASSGIGASATVQFTKEGANVVMVGRNKEKLKNVAELSKKNGKAPHVIIADISKDEDAIKIITDTIKVHGKLDVLLNNAGMSAFGSILGGNLLRSYDETLNTNLRGLVHLTELAAPHLIKTKGNIVFISSIAATASPILPTFIAYGVSKAGLNHFAKCAALELAPHSVRVNVISPGPVKTDIIENSGGTDSLKDIKFTTPLKRWSEPEEISDLILFLASDRAVGITGSNFVSDNGCLLAI